MGFQARATTFDLPLNGEFEISGDISAPLLVDFMVTANPTSSDGSSSGGSPSAGAGWVASVTLSQANGLGSLSTPQVCSSTGNCFLLSNFLSCGGSLGCAETNAVGFGYLRDGVSAPILISEGTNIFGVATSVSANPPIDLEFSVDLPDGLGIEIMQGLTLRNADFDSPAAATPIPATLPLLTTGLLILSLGIARKKRGEIRERIVAVFEPGFKG